VVGAGFLAFAAAIGTGWFGEVNYGLVVAFAAIGALAGVPVLLASRFGYALVARRRNDRSAIAGAVGGPLVLVGGIALALALNGTLQGMRIEADLQASHDRDAYWQAQSMLLHATVEGIETHLVDFKDLDTGAPRRGIDTGSLMLVLHPDVDMQLDPQTWTDGAARFDLVPIGPDLRGCFLVSSVPAGAPTFLAAGTDTRIAIELDVPDGCEQPPGPGTFRGELFLGASLDGNPGGYYLTVPVEIPS